MATTVLQAFATLRLFRHPQHVNISSLLMDVKAKKSVNYYTVTRFTCSMRSLMYSSSSNADKRLLLKPISAVDSGVEASISNPGENVVSMKNVQITVESKDEDKLQVRFSSHAQPSRHLFLSGSDICTFRKNIFSFLALKDSKSSKYITYFHFAVCSFLVLHQVRVNVTGKETQIVFDKTITNLASTAPPIPGFRRQKGGKTTKVPKEFLLQVIGKDRVTKFVIQELVTSTLADFVKKENLAVKDNKINTIQTADELMSQFVPGNDFGFNATLDLEKPTQEST